MGWRMNIKNALKCILAIFITLTFFFIFGEVGTRIYLRHKTIYDIEMTKYAMDVKTDSNNPLIGHVHKPGVTAFLMNSNVSINSDGLRDKEYSVARNEKYRMIFLGDSLTFGWGVEQGDTFEHILEAKANKEFLAEIINFGAGNYNTEQQVNLFLEKGLKYRPDKVVLFYFINDAEVTPKKSRLYFLGHSRLLSFYWSRVHAFMNKQFPSKSFKEYYAELYTDEQKGWMNTKKAFMELKDICREERIELQVVLLPELHDIKNRIFNNEYSKISAFLEKIGIKYLNLASMFESYSGDPIDLWVSYDDAHPNKIAHNAIAENTMGFIFGKGEVNSD